MSVIPVVTVDGYSGSGKGTISQLLAHEFNYKYLDSGAIYRSLALYTYNSQIAVDSIELIAKAANNMKLEFKFNNGLFEVNLDGKNVKEDIRTESIGTRASHLASHQKIRSAVLEIQKSFRQKPGLVADGRDMGPVVFPDAKVKFFLTASPEARAKRRQKQLKEQGISASLHDLSAELANRDERDLHRKISPMIPAETAITIDTTAMSIDEVFAATADVVKRSLI